VRPETFIAKEPSPAVATLRSWDVADESLIRTCPAIGIPVAAIPETVGDAVPPEPPPQPAIMMAATVEPRAISLLIVLCILLSFCWCCLRPVDTGASFCCRNRELLRCRRFRVIQWIAAQLFWISGIKKNRVVEYLFDISATRLSA
jgi:hypothetical protein